jgi:hypothetical protein
MGAGSRAICSGGRPLDEQRETWPQPLVESVDRWLGRAYRVEPLLYADLLRLRRQLAGADVRAHAKRTESRKQVRLERRQ